jgi:hypothetical protein
MKILIALTMLAVSTIASAQDKVVSVDAFDFAYSGGLLIKSDSGKGPDRDETTFRFNLNYAQNWQYVGVMVKGKVFINREDVDFGSADSLETRWGAAGGFLYNFQPDDIKNSIFAGALIGIERATYEFGKEDDKSGFNVFTDLEAGKRWDLGRYSVASISYAPTVAVTLKRYGGDIRDKYFRTGKEVKLNFLKFDILF